MSKVYLVGAGPGDIELLTLKAKRLIEQADVIVYDRLADEKILNFNTTAKKIYVGKSPGQHTMKQDEISKLLIDLSFKYEKIIRLKGGDPFVFGRGGEEALLLAENKIDFEIVPGVTSAIAVPSYAGIPVTHRGLAKNFAVITGHEMNDESNIKWDKLSTGIDTLIFLMSVANLTEITKKLIDNGRDRLTPAAIIHQGTKSQQKILISTLEKIAEEVKREKIIAPSIFIVGEVVRLREKLKWFDVKPLFNKKILVTRTRSQASKLCEQLKEFGAECLEIPAIKIIEPTDKYLAVDKAIDRLKEFDFVIFTSENGVKEFFKRMQIKNLDARSLSNSKIAVIGSETAAELNRHGIIADFIPKEFRAEAIIEMIESLVENKKILIPRAEVARSILPDALKELNAVVEVVPVYKTIPAIDKPIDLNGVDLITFTSSSTVINFINAVNIESIKKIKTAAIGPITAATLKNFGIDADIIAEEYTINGLVKAIVKNFK